MGEVERLLTECGVPKYYPRFSKASILTFDAMQRKRPLLPSLINDESDLRKVLSALGERASEFHGQPPVRDLVMDELQDFATKLRARLRMLANRHADQLISRVNPSRRPQTQFHRNPHSTPGGGNSRMAIAQINAKIDKTKLLLNSCSGAIKAHQRYMELSRMLRKYGNKAGEPGQVDATKAQVAEYEAYVKKVLVMLQEEAKRGEMDFRTIHIPRDEEETKEEHEEEPEPTTPKKTVREEQLELQLNAALGALADSEARRITAETTLRTQIATMQEDALRMIDNHEEAVRKVKQQATETLEQQKASFEEIIENLHNQLQMGHRIVFEQDAMMNMAKWGMICLDSGAELLATEIEIRGEEQLTQQSKEFDAKLAEVIAELENTQGDKLELQAEVKSWQQQADQNLQELGNAKVETEDLMNQLKEKTEQHAVALAAAVEETKKQEALRKVVEVDKEKLGRAAFDSREEANQLQKSLASIQEKHEELKAKIATETEDISTQTFTAAEWRAIHAEEEAALAAAAGGEHIDLPPLDGELPEGFKMTLAELCDALQEHGVAPELAHLHSGAIGRKAQELSAAVEKHTEEADAEDSDPASADGDGTQVDGTDVAESSLELLKAQLTLILALETAPQQNTTVKRANELVATGSDTTSTIASGPGVISHLLRETWELVETAVGFKMPLTRREAKLRAEQARARAVARSGKGGDDNDENDEESQGLRTLEDDILGTQEELLKIIRALRSAAFCYTTSTTPAPQRSPQKEDEGEHSGSRRDPTPIEIMGQRRN